MTKTGGAGPGFHRAIPRRNFNVRDVSYGDIQLLRFWRNSSHVRQHMGDRSLISFEEQIRWYQNIDSQVEKRLIYGVANVDVGSMHAKLADSSFEVGYMCGNKDYLGSWVNVAAALYIYDLGFIGAGKEVAHASIREENLPAMRLTEALGFTEASSSEGGLLHLQLEHDAYLSARERYAKLLFWMPGFPA